MKKCCEDKEINSCIGIVPIFSGLNEDEMSEVRRITNHKHFNKGDMIYQANDSISQLYVIHGGKIKISRITSDGKEQVIRILVTGEFLGELSIFSNHPTTDFAEALEDSSVCMLEGRYFKPLMEKSPQITFKILQELSKRLEVAEDLIENINLHSVESRLAQGLLKQMDQYDVVELQMSKGNFASQIGMSQETLSRKLTQFQDKKLIRMIGHRKIIILNKQKLEEYY